MVDLCKPEKVSALNKQDIYYKLFTTTAWTTTAKIPLEGNLLTCICQWGASKQKKYCLLIFQDIPNSVDSEANFPLSLISTVFPQCNKQTLSRHTLQFCLAFWPAKFLVRKIKLHTYLNLDLRLTIGSYTPSKTSHQAEHTSLFIPSSPLEGISLAECQAGTYTHGWLCV